STSDPSALVGSKDLYDYLCGPDSTDRHDIALSTAALLSARFPYISPTGALNGCQEPQRRTYDIDGGLLESSGVSSLTEIWTRIALVRSWFHPVPTARTGFCLTGFAARATGPNQTGPPTLARFTGSFADHVGVAGVRLDVDGCTPAPQITCSVTTDASGRFTL